MSATDARLADWFASRVAWPEAVLPAYDGGCVGNLAASVLRAFGLPTDDPRLLPPLSDTLLPPALLTGARVIVLLVVDGLGELALRRATAVGAAPGLLTLPWRRQLTSVFPSTTTAALTSIQTGAAPGQHGLAGYTLYLPEAGRVVNMLTFKPVDGGAFAHDAPLPETFNAAPTMFERLKVGGVESVVVSHREYERSPLTRVQSGDTPYAGHRTLAELAALTLQAVESGGPRFIFAYWAGLDMLAHAHGPRSAACALELELVDHALRAGLFEPLERLGANVVVLVTADHGLATLDPAASRSQNVLNDAAGGWSQPPSGERRALGIAVADPAGVERIARVVAESGALLDVDEAIEAGLYGPPPRVPELRGRIGDTLILARDGASFPYRSSRDTRDPATGGSHGSLTQDEMLVPLLARRF